MPTRTPIGAFRTALVIAIAVLASSAPSALASHAVDRFVGGEGRFLLPSGPALDPDTGQLYVTESGAHRIQRLDEDGNLELMWGAGVKTGANSFEICTAADAPCNSGAESSAAGVFKSPTGVALSPVNGHLYVYDNGNRRVQEFSFDENGTPADPSDDLPVFVRAWGWGVQNGANAFQICTAGCQSGSLSTDNDDNPGQMGSNSSANAVAISPIDGDVFVGEGADRHIHRFNSNGTLDAVPLIGGPFGSFSVSQVAVDSQGIVYGRDSENGMEIERYDAYGAHGSPGFLAPIAAPPLLPNGSISGFAVELDPEGDGAAGLTTDRLFVLRGPAAGVTAIQQFDSPGELIPPAAETLPRHGVGLFTGADTGRGLAYSASSDRFYIADGDNGTLGVGDGIYILDTNGSTSVSAEIDAFTNVTPTQIDLNGTISGEGPVRYYFEHAEGSEPFVRTKPKTVEVAGEVTVTETISSLEPHTTYRVRFTAEKIISPTVVLSDVTAEQQFSTPKAPPGVATRPVHSFTDTAAWLVADIDSNNLPTEYRFEWGPTDSYGSAMPMEPIPAVPGNKSAPHLQELTGLQPETTYHYRVVADNGTDPDSNPVNGTAVFGDDQTFTTRSAFEGFAERAYEQVTPVNKNGKPIQGGHDGVAADGSAVVFTSYSAVGEQAEAGSATLVDGFLQFQARRNPAGDGWTTRDLVPRALTQTEGVTATVQLLGGANDSIAAFPHRLSMPGTVPNDVPGLYRRNLLSGGIEKLVENPLTPGGDNDPSAIGPLTKMNASADLGSVLFQSGAMFALPGEPVGTHKLYELSGGQLRLVGVDPDGNPFPGTVIIGRGTAVSDPSTWARIANDVRRTAVSADGRHVFFSTPSASSTYPNTMRIYRRSDGTSTELASPSQASVSDPQGPKAKLFSEATPDGESVFFMSSEQLTDDANTGPTRSGNDLYRYDLSTDTLIDISAQSADQNGAQVVGLLGASDDGDWAYYVARGRAIAGKGVAGARNVYLWREGAGTTYVTTLGSGEIDGRNLGEDGGSVEKETASRVSADGRTLLLQSAASLTGYPNQGHSQLYVYEAEADSGEGALTCVSCRPDGTSANSGSTVVGTGTSTSEGGRTLARVLSADGRRVLFDTTDGLLDADTDGKRDVYLWEAGRLTLVSGGNSPYDSYLHGASADADDIFFKTYERLVGQDDDGLLDIYDYRVGGGIPEQHPPSPGEPCIGEACKTTISQVAAPRLPGSRATTEGNLGSRADCSTPAKRAKAFAKRAKRAAKQGKKRRAAVLNKRAKRTAGKAKRCRARARGGEGR